MNQIDDASPLIRPLKEAFCGLAYPHAAELQQEINAGRLTHGEALQRLIDLMEKPRMIAALLKASRAGETAQ